MGGFLFYHQILFNDGELIEKQVCAKNARTGPDGKRLLYLDVIIAVGYRVKSPMLLCFVNGRQCP